MSAYLIGTDIGTSGTKSVLVDTDGTILAESLVEHSILMPQPVWAEQWPEVWVSAAKETIKQVVAKAKVDKRLVKGLCISGLYGGSGIPLDSEMNPVRPCIIWMDRRAEQECALVQKMLSVDELFETTGNAIDPYFGFTKILWIKHNEPDNWKKIRLFLPPNQYVVYQFTGSVAMDYTSAGNLGGIYDLKKSSWSYDLMDKMGIPHYMMPEKLVEPKDVVGELSAGIAQELGLNAGTPVCAGCIDCLASTLATGALYDNQHTAIIGTSINWGVIHSKLPTNQSYITMPYAKNPKAMYYTYGGASTAGALPKWFRDNFTSFGASDVSYDMLNNKAANIDPGSNGLIMLPYFMGERSPIWDVNAKGTIVGLTLHHTQAHVYRAILESVAYALRHIMETSQIAIDESTICTLIGGATKSSLWKRIFADVTGVPIHCSSQSVEAPLGDALIAGVGIGVLNDYSAIGNWVKFDQEVLPNRENHELYSQYFALYKKVYHSLKDDMAELSRLNKSSTQKTR